MEEKDNELKDNGKKEPHESDRSNILSMENGFNTRVNLFIIRYLYYHMKKHSKFLKKGKGTRQASVDLNVYVGISRPRFTRIFSGENFEMAETQSRDISKLFNISADYFKKNGKLIEIHGIDRDDWKCYFNSEFRGSVIMDELDEQTTPKEEIEKWKKEKMARALKVDEKLQELVETNFVANHYDAKTALYRIHYFFKNGVAFTEVSTLNKFLKYLQLLKISDWKALKSNPEEMKKYLDMLEKHYEYINAYLKFIELEKMN